MVVDEVHERSLDSDYLLIVLRDALKANPNLKVVLMSATLDADLFSRYFGGCEVLSIPGRTYPVTEHFVEDAIEASGYVAKGRQVLTKEEADAEVDDDEGIAHGRADEGARSGYSERTRHAVQRIVGGSAPADLVACLLRHVDERESAEQQEQHKSSGGGGGAVLVFLPGVAEIRRLGSELLRADGAERWHVLPLHGELAPAEQRRVFAHPPRGKRKVRTARGARLPP